MSEIMPDKRFTEVVDGQQVVRTLAQSGTIIPEPDKDPAKYFTALVQTDDGPQQVVKVYDMGGGGSGGVTENKIIIKSATIPTASSSNYGYMYCYNGETNATYTHGYIYENKKEATYEGSITFTPNTITVSDEDFSAFLNAGIEYMPEPDEVTHGTMTYHYASGIWRLVGYDENNVEVGHRQLYQTDYEDAGFVFSGSFEDGDELTFVSTIEESSVSYSWVRIDVQPGGGSPIVVDQNYSATSTNAQSGTAVAQALATISSPTLTWYKNNTGTTVTIADTTGASLVKVYKNGILLEPTADYTISGTTLTLTSALESNDKITTEVL